MAKHNAHPRFNPPSLQDFETYQLANGLTVVLHHDLKRTVCAVNVLYKVGSRNDPPGRTGFAHLFEHLMFAGSENVDNFDDVLQLAGGENNAMTGADTTVYYDVLPAANVETALYLESDRMRKLKFSARSLANEKKVVVEEFKETCLEEPYGDLLHHLSALVYKEHPYRWPVIGESFEHIQQATMEDVKNFYYRYYRPDNAVLVIAGGFDATTIKEGIEHYFGSIPTADDDQERPELPGEPEQTEVRETTVEADVPSPVIYLHYRTPGRLDDDYQALDVATFLLGGGRSSFLHRKLVRDQEIFAELSANLTDTYDYGGVFIEGRPAEDVDYGAAKQALLEAIEEFVAMGVTEAQLTKTINRLDHINQYKGLSVAGRASELAFYASIDRLDLVEGEAERYLSLTVGKLNEVIEEYLVPQRLSIVNYLAAEEE